MKNAKTLLFIILGSLLFSCKKSDVEVDNDLIYKEKLEKLIKLKPQTSASAASSSARDGVSFKSYKDAYKAFYSLLKDTLTSVNVLKTSKSLDHPDDQYARSSFVQQWNPLDFGNGYTFTGTINIFTSVTNDLGPMGVLFNYRITVGVYFPAPSNTAAIYSMDVINPEISIYGFGPTTGAVDVFTQPSGIGQYSSMKEGTVTIAGTTYTYYVGIVGSIQGIADGFLASPTSCSILTTMAVESWL